MLLSICAVEDLETKHIDIKCAFLNGALEEEVYRVQHPMFSDGSGRIWRLKKAPYGLKQAARDLHRALAQLLSDLGFERCASDPALYVSKVGRCPIFVWVDDLLVFSAKDPLQRWSEKYSQHLRDVICVVIYMHTMHAWLTVQMLWQMHGRTLQAVHMLIICMGIILKC